MLSLKSRLLLLVVTLADVWWAGIPLATAADTVPILVQTARPRQTFEGLGAGVIFYEGHVTSLAARNHRERQKQLYDDMFTRVPTNYLQLMIRETHEPQNDNGDPWKPAFDDKNFVYCEHTLAIAKAARERRRDMRLLATLYTPPPWMKTNNDASGGGEAKATLKPGMDLELAEYVWAFLDYMHRGGATIDYLCISNEPDWPHTQPAYYLAPDQHASLFKKVAMYLEKMAETFPDVPRPKLVAANTLSAPGAAKDYLPPVIRSAGKYLDVVGSHDYDPRGDRWGDLRKIAGKRPVWMTEWCAREKDHSPGMIHSAIKYGEAMHEGFSGGANVWLAYDWAYPPCDSGEALIHIDWGNDYQLTKPYQLFRQWAEPLTPGMKVVSCAVGARGSTKAAVLPTAFLSADGQTLVVHVVNAQETDIDIALKLTGKFASLPKVARKRTSATEDAAELEPLAVMKGTLADRLLAKSMVTYLLRADAK